MVYNRDAWQSGLLECMQRDSTIPLGAHRGGSEDCCSYASAQEEAVGITKAHWFLLNQNLSKVILCSFSLKATSPSH